MNIRTLRKCYNISAKYYDTAFKGIQDIKYRTLLKLFAIHDKDKVLDLGCGTGLLYEFLSTNSSYDNLAINNNCKMRFNHKQKKIKLYGIDFSENMIHAAKERKYYAVCGEASKLPYRNNFFNIITAFTVIGLTEEIIPDIISEISRVIVSNGIFCLSILKQDFSNDIISCLEKNGLTILHLLEECGQDVGIIAVKNCI